MGAFKPGRSRTGNGITTLRRVPWRFTPTQQEGTPSAGAHKISLPVKEPTPVLAALALSTFVLASYPGGVFVSRETTAGGTPFGREFDETSGQPAPTQGPKYNGRISANFHVPPEITSLSYTVGDTSGGGQSVVITGLRLGGATDVRFGGVLAKITGNTSTTVTCTLPPHERGVVDVVVTTSSEGPSTGGVGAFEYWTPSQIAGIHAYLDAAKGIDLNVADVVSWADQSANQRVFSQASSTERPDFVTSVFGTMPAVRFAPLAFLDNGGAAYVQAAGRSVFFVVAWTSTAAAPVDYAGNVPLVLVGDTTGADHTSVGVSDDQIALSQFPTNWVVADPQILRGSGLNDGNVRLCGVTHSTGGDVKAYVGATQQGATASGVTYETTFNGYNCIGAGQPNVGAAGDGFDGDVGAIVISDGVLSGGDLTKLNNWAKQRFGTP